MTQQLPVSKNHEQRGIALVTSLLLLSLFTVMTLSMVIATTSDTLIDGYYRDARGSFYAADSGVKAARQALLNQVSANALPSGYTPSGGSPNMVSPATLLATVTNSSTGFGSYQSILPSSGASSTSWPAKFKLDTTNTTFGYATVPCSPSPQCNNGSTTAVTTATPYVYNYVYHIVANGQAHSGQTSVVEEYGTITYTINMNPSTTSTASFAAYGTLLDQYGLCSGAFVPGTMSGKMFSNQSWNFGDATANGSSTKYVFTGNVGAVNAKVGYIYGGDGTCDQVSTTSDTHKGVTINPTFSGGLSLGQHAIPLPTDSFNQEKAVLDGNGGCPAAGSGSCTAPTNAQLAVLTNPAGTSWSSSATSGVFLPYNNSTKTLTLNATTGAFGGIYVQGNVDQMTLTASTSGSGASTHKLQVVTIKQGSTTTTVTLDLTGNTTTIADNAGHTSGAMTGLPQNVSTSPTAEGAMVYVTGNISGTSGSTTTGLSGPSSGAAVQNGSGITITAGGTIAITGDIKYSTEPVTLNTADTPTSPVPTNVLGIYTTGGNVQLRPPTNVSTMEIDASIATIATGGSYGITATWNTIGTVNIVGGRVQNTALSGSSVGARNIYFDQRFSNGFAPPWFPTTTITTTTTNTAVPQTPVPVPTSWVNTSAQ